MNNKMAMNIYLSITEYKKQTKQKEQRHNQEYRELFNGCQMGEGGGVMSEEMRRLRSTNRQLQNRHGDVKYIIGNRVDKEPMDDPCM